MSTLLKMQKIHPLCSRCIRMYPLQNRWTVLRYLQCYENFSECCTHLILPETALFSPTPTFAKEPKYDVLLDRITNGSKWQFRLKANPVVYKKIAQSKRGKPVAHITTAYQEEWLEKQAAKHGFALEEDQWLVTESKWYRFRKGDSRQYVRILAVTYEGVLTVTDAECFQLSLMQGIGRGKAYGLGMLTVAGEH